MRFPRIDRRRAEFVAALFLIIGSIAIGVASFVLQLVNAAALDRGNRTDDLNACRAAYAAELVSGPTAEGMKALAENDRPAMIRAADRADPDGYQDLVRESRVHPDDFLRKCHTMDP